MNQLYDSNDPTHRLNKAQQLSSFLAKVQTFQKSKNLLDQLNPPQKFIYLDKKQTYAVVQGSYIKELLANSQIASQNLTKMSKELFDSNNKLVYLETTLSLMSEQLNKSKKNQTTLINQIIVKDKQIDNLLLQQKQKINMVQDTIKKIQKRSQSSQKNQKIISFDEKSNNIKSLNQCGIQTQYLISGNAQSQVQEMDVQELHQQQQNQEKDERKKQADELQLKLVFKRIISQLTEKFEQKIKNFKLQEEQLSQWKEKCYLIERQNQQIKKKIYQVYTQEEKVRIWKQNTLQFIQKVETKYMAAKQKEEKMDLENKEDEDENVNEKLKRLKKLEKKILENNINKLSHQQKLRKIDQVLKEETKDIPDEGALNNLLKTSIKIREAVKYMMQIL